MNKLSIIKKIEDNEFYDNLDKILEKYKKDQDSHLYNEELIDIIIDIKIYDKGFTETFKSAEIIKYMQYGFNIMMLSKTVKLYNKFERFAETDSGRELMRLLRDRFDVKGKTIFELKCIVAENKGDKILKSLMKLISDYISIYDDYNFCYSSKEEDEINMLKNIMSITINIRNGLKHYSERKDEVNILNNIIDVILDDGRIQEED